MYVIYGIKNCDTMKKAFKWLEEAGITYHFHDYRKEGFEESLLNQWLTMVDVADLINKRSTSWRNLDDSIKAKMTDNSIAKAQLLETPTLIKRPILYKKNHLLIGFKPETYREFIDK